MLVVSGYSVKTGIQIWDVATGKERPFAPLHNGSHVLAFSPGGEFLAVAEGNSVRLLSAKDLLNGSEKVILEEVEGFASVGARGRGPQRHSQ